MANYLLVIFLLLYLCYLHKASFLENESYGIQAILVGLSGTCDFRTRLNKASTGLLGLRLHLSFLCSGKTCLEQRFNGLTQCFSHSHSITLDVQQGPFKPGSFLLALRCPFMCFPLEQRHWSEEAEGRARNLRKGKIPRAPLAWEQA